MALVHVPAEPLSPSLSSTASSPQITAAIPLHPGPAQRQHEPYTNQGQLPGGMHTGSDICSRSSKAHPVPAPDCRQQCPEPAGLMRSTWDPHLVAIEQGAVLGRRKHRFPAAQRKGEECPWQSGGPGVPPSLHRLSRDAFARGAKAPDRALLLCWHRWSLSQKMCSILPWAEPPTPQLPPFLSTGVHRLPVAAGHGSHGSAGPLSLMHVLSPPVWC